MKKVLSVMLAALLLACCIPFPAFAINQYTYPAPGGEFEVNADGDAVLASDTEYTIPSGVTMTVPSGVMLSVPASTTLRVSKGGKLEVFGSIWLRGQLICDGELEGSKNIDLVGNGSAEVEFRFPNLSSDELGLSDKIKVYCYNEESNSFKTVPLNEATPYHFPLNSEVRIYSIINEPDPTHDKFDDSLFPIEFHNVGLTYMPGQKISTANVADDYLKLGYFTTTASTGGDVTFPKWSNDSDYLTTKKISLPSGDGYECIPRDPNVVKSSDGAVYVKYGEPFSFKVLLDDAYDMSDYQVYIYNGYGWLQLDADDGFQAGADEYNYYNIAHVEDDLTVSVRGVMKNSTINLIGNLLETFKSIFNMLKEFLASLKEMFAGMKSGE